MLFSSAFWRPLFDAIRETMLAGARQTIHEKDLDLVRITDDPAEAAELLRAES